MYAIIKDHVVIKFPIYNIKKEFRNISFPQGDVLDSALPPTVVKVLPSQQPEIDQAVEKLILDPLPILVEGAWYATYSRVALSAGELADIRAAKLNELKFQRDEAISQPINGFQVATNEDRENIAGAIDYFDQLSVDGCVTWTMADNTEQVVSLADLKGAKDGYVIRKASVFQAYQVGKKELGE